MPLPKAATPAGGDARIWAYAFGYFACYAPYSALTKLVSQGKLGGMKGPIDGFEMLPVTTVVSLLGMLIFLSVMRWWRYAGRASVFGVSLPSPNRWTFLSGVATAAVIATTTLAYTFKGVSIVFMMLLMRGGVLAIAPVVDAFGKRGVRAASWVALALSSCGLLVTLADGASYELSVIAALDVAVYLTAYFVRLRFMSRLAKSADKGASIRFFVEEQMVATPTIVLFLAGLAVLGQGPVMLSVRAGFTTFFDSGAVLAAIAIGLFSQGTGIFGALILLDGRENAFCVPVNRASSILAGVVASASLALLGLGRGLATTELIGAGFVLGAIIVLALPRSPGAAAPQVPPTGAPAAGGG
jgi:hypothetical protein